MSKTKLTVYITDKTNKAMRFKAIETGKKLSQVVEEALEVALS